MFIERVQQRGDSHEKKVAFFVKAQRLNSLVKPNSANNVSNVVIVIEHLFGKAFSIKSVEKDIDSNYGSRRVTPFDS